MFNIRRKQKGVDDHSSQRTEEGVDEQCERGLKPPRNNNKKLMPV